MKMIEHFNSEILQTNKIIRQAVSEARKNGIKLMKYLYIPKHHEFSSLFMFLAPEFNLVAVLYNKDELVITEEKIKENV